MLLLISPSRASTEYGEENNTSLHTSNHSNGTMEKNMQCKTNNKASHGSLGVCYQTIGS